MKKDLLENRPFVDYVNTSGNSRSLDDFLRFLTNSNLDTSKVRLIIETFNQNVIDTVLDGVSVSLPHNCGKFTAMRRLDRPVNINASLQTGTLCRHLNLHSEGFVCRFNFNPGKLGYYNTYPMAGNLFKSSTHLRQCLFNAVLDGKYSKYELCTKSRRIEKPTI